MSYIDSSRGAHFRSCGENVHDCGACYRVWRFCKCTVRSYLLDNDVVITKKAPLCKGGCRRRRLGDCQKTTSSLFTITCYLKQSLRHGVAVPPPHRHPFDLPNRRFGVSVAFTQGRLKKLDRVVMLFTMLY